MNILAIDTSTRTLSLALAKQDKVISYRNERLNRRMADVMMPRVVRFLEKNSLTLKKIDAYIIGLGPGSFTSLRVGVATLKGLCCGLDLPVVGISSLDAIATAANAVGQPMCVINDARRELLYTASYEATEQGPVRNSEYQLFPWKDIKRAIRKPIVFAGDGVELYKKEISTAFGPDAALTGSKFTVPQARFLVARGWARLQAGETEDIATLEPLYLYAEDCQVRK